jgi:hypothetical protein
MRKIRTPEEKVAKTLATLINDVSLNLDEIGIHLANNVANVSFRRLQEVVESAEHEKSRKFIENDTNTLF